MEIKKFAAANSAAAIGTPWEGETSNAENEKKGKRAQKN